MYLFTSPDLPLQSFAELLQSREQERLARRTGRPTFVAKTVQHWIRREAQGPGQHPEVVIA